MERCYRCMRGNIVNGVCNNCRRRPAIHTGAAGSKLVLQPGTPLLNGEITVGALLGKGGFGATYVADSAYDGVIALKEFLPGYMVQEAREDNSLVILPDKQEIFHKSLAAFEKEAELLSKLKHKNIVKVLFKFWENNTVYYGMELLEGTDLSTFMKARKGIAITAEVAADFIERMYPVMDALQSLHRWNVYHRDISPANIFLRGWNKDRDKYNINFDPCLIDFGAAFVARDDYTKSVTRVKNLYYSPYEQNLSSNAIGPASDIYSFCATLYHALTGEAPQPAVDRMTDGDELKKPSEINPALQPLDEVLMYGMKLISRERIQNMEQLIYEFKQAVAALRGKKEDAVREPVGPTPAPVPPVPKPIDEKNDRADARSNTERIKHAPKPEKDPAVKSIFALLIDIIIPVLLALPVVFITSMVAPMVPVALILMLIINIITMLAAKRSLGMLMLGMAKRASAGRRILAAFLRTIVPFALVDVIISACGAYAFALSNAPAEAQTMEIHEDESFVQIQVKEEQENAIPQIGSSKETERIMKADPLPSPKRARFALIADYNGQDGQPARYLLHDNTKYRVGRLNCEILIPESKATVSKYHCDVEVRDDAVLIKDRSTNGCFYKGTRMEKETIYRWRPGDKVKLGDQVIFQLVENK